MIKLLVWSKDRACQLELLLNSLNRHAAGLFDINIIYTFSSGFYKAGYKKLQDSDYAATWIYETNLQKQTRDFINSAEDHVSFSTDDQVFFKHVNQESLLKHLPQNDNEIFSFRLGFNTLVQDCHAGTYQRPLYNYVIEDDIVSWNTNEYHPFDNYGYPLALDTHVFRATKMQELISYFEFKNTNQLESKMQNYTSTINRMSSFTNSVSVNIPCNNMSTITRSGEKFAFDVQFLNEQFLNGKRLDLDSIESNAWVGCHQEFDLQLIEN